MLTPELLKANTSLQGLTEDQIKAITELSKNDENDVIGKKIGEVYGALDADVLSVTGIAKNGTEKTYDYTKRVLNEFKTKSEEAKTLQSQIDALNKDKKHLEEVISKGSGDQETAKKLKQAIVDLDKVKSDYNELNKKYNESETNHANEIFNIKIDGELSAATKGLKFRSDIPDTVKDIVIQQAIQKIKGFNPEITDEHGTKKIIFRDEKGSTMLNKSNNLNPYTPAELLSEELGTMDVLEKKRVQGGSGTKEQLNHQQNHQQNKAEIPTFDLSGAKTQAEAYNAITSALKQQGYQIGSDEFEEALGNAWTDNQVTSLPKS